MSETVEFPSLIDCQTGLELSMHAAWALDLGAMKIFWANDQALELWGPTTREELFSRDLVKGVPASVFARMNDSIARGREGEVVRQEWHLYPRGKKTAVITEGRLVWGEFGELVLLLQAVPLGSDTNSDHIERSVAMFRYSTVISVLIQADGSVASQNLAAGEVFGTRSSWLEWLEDSREGEALLQRSFDRETHHALVCVVPEAGGRRWHMVATRVIRDPVTTQLAVLAEHTDVSAQVEAEDLADTRGRHLAALEASLELVETQREEILALSAPLLEVGARTLAVPLIGKINRARADALMAKLLDAVVARQIQEVILDLTGVVALEADNATQLEKLVSALALLGTQTVFTGMRPALAKQLALRNFEHLRFFRSLAGGLRAGAPHLKLSRL